MNKKLYELMNWPQIEAVEYGECQAPLDLLGGHVVKSGFLIQAFRPDAAQMNVKASGKIYPMEQADESGWFAALLPGKKEQAYTLVLTRSDGTKEEYDDPYCFVPRVRQEDLKAFEAGTLKRAQTVLGNRVSVNAGRRGVTFTVWAPGALGVSVVGDFNGFSPKMHLMQKQGESDVYALFIPGVKPGEAYAYDIAVRGGRHLLKYDPFACDARVTKGQLCSVTGKAASYSWKDEDFLETRRMLHGEGRPTAICRLDLRDFLPSDENGESAESAFAAITRTALPKIRACGFSYVQLPQLTVRSRAGAGSLLYFAIDPVWGSARELKQMVDAFHEAGLGVIADFPAAFLPGDEQGLVSFTGDPVFEAFRTRIDAYGDTPLFTFQYARPQVRMFLICAAQYLADEFHLDGLQVSDVATMLYLDYGKNPGEWQTNLYGGNENFDAADFLKEFNHQLHEIPGFLTIDKDESAWKSSTGDTKDSLGFDYKENLDFEQMLREFAATDPLFRSGQYDKLSETMLYHYMEDFLLPFPDDIAFPEATGEERDKDFAAALGFCLCMPGIKSLPFKSFWQEEERTALVRDFLKLYKKAAPLHELDQDERGFSWVQDDDTDQVVLLFARTDANGHSLLAALNFTPVQRKNYTVGLDACGHFKVIFSTEAGHIGETFDTGFESYTGSEYSLTIDLPGLSCTVLELVPYDRYEMEEFKIRSQAAKARQQVLERETAADRRLQEARDSAARTKQAEEETKKRSAEAVQQAKADANQAIARAKAAADKAIAQAKREAEQAIKAAEEAAREAEDEAAAAARTAKEAADEMTRIKTKEKSDLKRLEESKRTSE